MPVLYEIAMFCQDELLSSYIEENGSLPHQEADTVTIQFPNPQITLAHVGLSQEAYRRNFDSELHACGICSEEKLGDKFFFLSGCQHYFCFDCMKEMVIQKIKDGMIHNLVCPDSSCKKQLNDRDVKNLNLDADMVQLYEKVSLENAIS